LAVPLWRDSCILLGLAVSVVDFRTDPPGRVSLLFIAVVVALLERMKLRGLDVERVAVLLIVRLADDPAGLPREAVLDFPEPTVLVPPAPVGSRRAVMDGLLIVIGRVIRVVLDEPMVLFDLAIEDFGAIVVRVDPLVIIVVERRVGAMVVVLFEGVGDCLVVAVVDRLFTITGRVMRVVLDELKVLFDLVVGDLYVLAVERLLTLTDPGVVLGPMVILRFVGEEVDDLGVGEAGRDVLRLLEGARLGVDLAGARLGVILDGVRLGALRVGDRLGVVRLGVLLTGERLGVVRLGVLLTGDRLGVVRLGVLLTEDRLGVVLPDDREFDFGVLLDVLRVETCEASEVDGALAAGFGVGMGFGLETAFGVSLTMGLVAAGFGVALTTGLETASFGVDLTTGLETAGFGVDLTVGLGAARFGVDFVTGLGGVALTAGLGAALDAAFVAGLGVALGAGLGAAFGAGLGAAFAWGAAGLPVLLWDFSAKAGATHVIRAKTNAINRTFASCCNLMIDMIGLLSSLSGFFTYQDS